MKALIKFDDRLFLVPFEKETKSVNSKELFSIVNEDRYPDECFDLGYVMSEFKILAYMTDESEFCS